MLLHIQNLSKYDQSISQFIFCWDSALKPVLVWQIIWSNSCYCLLWKSFLPLWTAYVIYEWYLISLAAESVKSVSWQTTRRPSKITRGSFERYTISKSILIKAKRRKLPPFSSILILGNRAWNFKCIFVVLHTNTVQLEEYHTVFLK